MKDAALLKEGEKKKKKAFYNCYLKLPDFVFTGTALFAYNCNTQSSLQHLLCQILRSHISLTLASSPGSPAFTSFSLYKGEKLRWLGRVYFQKQLRVLSFHFRQEPCHKVTCNTFRNAERKKVWGFFLLIHVEINTNVFVENKSSC